MTTNYVLIDFENVQPKNLDVLKQHPFKIKVFVGANQNKIPLELAASLQALGESAEYIQISGSGKNALDFHIAYYIGELFAEDSSAYFHIISRDTGFDPLIKHLKSKKVRIQRERDLAEIPVVRMSSSKNIDEQVDAIIKNLAGRGQSKPRKMTTLSNTINSLFTEKLTEQQLTKLVEKLKSQGLIEENNGSITYHLGAVI